MNSVRKALGQKLLHYLGNSYGTALGLTYAALFPDHVGRIVLDGVLDIDHCFSPNKRPELDIGDANLALKNFFQACHEAGSKSCSIWTESAEDIRKKFFEADQAIYNSPLPVPGYGLLKWPLWRYGVYNALYRPSEGFALLAGGIAEVLDGTAEAYAAAYLQIA